VTMSTVNKLRNLSASCSGSATESDTDDDLGGVSDVCGPGIAICNN